LREGGRSITSSGWHIFHFGMATSLDIIGDTSSTTVNRNAAHWIAALLRSKSESWVQPEPPDSEVVSLSSLTVNQLKLVAKEVSERLRATKTAVDFVIPKSTARKNQWCVALSRFFSDSQAYAAIKSSAGAGIMKPSSVVAVKQQQQQQHQQLSANAHQLHGGSNCGIRVRQAPTSKRKAASSVAVAAARMPSPKKPAAPNGGSITGLQNNVQVQRRFSANPPATASLALARRLNGDPTTQLLSANLFSGPSFSHLPAGYAPAAFSAHAATASNPSARITATTSAVPDAVPSSNTLQTTDQREIDKVNSLLTMGFTNKRENLEALRVVQSRRPVGGGCMGHSEHVEAAMMWLVSQREDVSNALLMDQARIESERAEEVAAKKRQAEKANELRNASPLDLIGTNTVQSKYYPSSFLLANDHVRQIFSSILLDGASESREQVLKYLGLEKKARQWYGALPFCYFQYDVIPRFEGWKKGGSLRQRLSDECSRLETVLFKISEQQEGGLGRVPKAFVLAQLMAEKNGKITRQKKEPEESEEDPDVKFLGVGCKPATPTSENAKSPHEVIDLL